MSFVKKRNPHLGWHFPQQHSSPQEHFIASGKEQADEDFGCSVGHSVENKFVEKCNIRIIFIMKIPAHSPSQACLMRVAELQAAWVHNRLLKEKNTILCQCSGSGKTWATLEHKLGNTWATPGQHLGNIWTTLGQHLGSIWATLGQHLGNTWATPLNTCVTPARCHLGNAWQYLDKNWATLRQ